MAGTNQGRIPAVDSGESSSETGDCQRAGSYGRLSDHGASAKQAGYYGQIAKRKTQGEDSDLWKLGDEGA